MSAWPPFIHMPSLWPTAPSERFLATIVSLFGHKNYNLSIILPIARADGGSCAIFQKCHFRRRGGTGAVKSARWLAAC